MTVRMMLAAALLPLPMVPLAAQSTVTVPVVAITGTQLDIVARGKTTRVPDVATISAGVVTQAADAATAMRDNAARISRVVAALERAGVAERDIQTSTISLSPQYRYKDGEAPQIMGYQANNTVSVRFRDIARSGAILDALVREGANQINGPDLSIDKPEAAMDEARVAAMKEARARAELYAKAAGMRVKRILSISESGDYPPPRPMPMMAMRVQSEAAADSKIAAGEQDVEMTLSVRFELE
jgi:uncharacterized protein YggE